MRIEAEIVNVSVVICTYNRAAVLETTLASACRLADPREPWELLVIDNNSRDD
ncbi:MAG: glycosyltransferase, partial [Thermoguttaceae bacterium]|nr:glycosyltransferase [Thermoguttaceae bacterium]